MRSFSKAEEPALCPQCGGQGQKLVSVFASKAGFYLGVPAKEAFRRLPERKTSKKSTAKKTKPTRQSKSGQ